MYIIHLGFPCLPHVNAAPVQRIQLTFKGLQLLGVSVLIINKHSTSAKKYEYKKITRFNGLPFMFTSFFTYRPDNFLVRNLNKLAGFIGELLLLFKKRKKIHTAILYTSSFGQLVYYRLVSKLFKFNLIIQYVEFRSALSINYPLANRINDKLFDKYFYLFCDGIIAVSEYLKDYVISKSLKMPLIKLPVIFNFDDYQNISLYPLKSYFLYCGNILYLAIINFIIEIFEISRSKGIYNGKLVLVISGSHNDNWINLKDKLAQSKHKNDIILKSNISYAELFSLYKSADILMIPLRNTTQDLARFPHKIGEYTAAKRPILSTNLGEPNVYFKDGVSAILADEYSIESYIEKLTTVLSTNVSLGDIGEAGYKVGLKYFDYHSQAASLKYFIFNL